jgi:hypothetical protein
MPVTLPDPRYLKQSLPYTTEPECSKSYSQQFKEVKRQIYLEDRVEELEDEVALSEAKLVFNSSI